MQIFYTAVQLSGARYSQKNINVHSRMPASDHIFQYKVEIKYSQRKKTFKIVTFQKEIFSNTFSWINLHVAVMSNKRSRPHLMQELGSVPQPRHCPASCPLSARQPSCGDLRGPQPFWFASRQQRKGLFQTQLKPAETSCWFQRYWMFLILPNAEQKVGKKGSRKPQGVLHLLKGCMGSHWSTNQRGEKAD